MQFFSTDLLIALALLGPLAMLAWVLIRRARRIQEELLDKQARTREIDQLSPAIVRFVLERDSHTCQICGSRQEVGVDFRQATPPDPEMIGPDMLEARCSRCYDVRWGTLETRTRS